MNFNLEFAKPTSPVYSHVMYQVCALVEIGLW